MNENYKKYSRRKKGLDIERRKREILSNREIKKLRENPKKSNSTNYELKYNKN